MRATLAILVAFGLMVVPAASFADQDKAEEKAEKKAEKREDRRETIDEVQEETMKELLEKSPEARELFEAAYGFATFAQTEAKLLFSGGSGRGLAVVKETGDKTYMKMASAGVGLGLGVQRVRVVFLFETQKRFTRFVEEGWDADASATAAAGTDGANAKVTFSDGMAIFQFTKAGLIAQASVKGTKYWQADKLNEDAGE